MGLTGDPVADGSRSGAMTHSNDQRSVSTQRDTSSEIAGNPRVQANRVDGQDVGLGSRRLRWCWERCRCCLVAQHDDPVFGRQRRVIRCSPARAWAASQQRGATAARGRRARSAQSRRGRGLVGAGWGEPRGGARGARRAWWRTCGTTAGPPRVPAGTSNTATQRHTGITPDQRSPVVTGPGRLLAHHRQSRA
jgi:hypothetical protein